MDWSVALGLTKEAPVEPYLQGLQFRELQEKKKIAAAQAAKERQDKLGALLKYQDADIHQSLVNEYTKKANEILLPAYQKFKQGVLTEPEAFQTQAALIDLKNQYQSTTKSLREFQNDEKIKTAHGAYLRHALRNGTPIEQIYKNSEYEDNPYSRLFTKEGQLDWTNAYSGTINPFEDLEKANKNSIVLKRESKGDYIMETKGIPKDRATLIKSGIYSDTEGIPTWQEMLQEASNRPTFVSDVAATYPKQFYQAEQNAQRAYIETKLKERGIAMNDPNLKNYVTEITNEMQNDPMTLRSLKQKAAVDVGMQYQTGVSTTSTNNPKTTFNFGGGGLSKAGEGGKFDAFYTDLKNGINNQVKKVANTKSSTPEQILNIYSAAFTGKPAITDVANKAAKTPNSPISIDLNMGNKMPNEVQYQTLTPNTKVTWLRNGRRVGGTYAEFLKENKLPDQPSYNTQIPTRASAFTMNFMDNSGNQLTYGLANKNKSLIPMYKPMFRVSYSVNPVKEPSENPMIQTGKMDERDTYLKSMHDKGLMILQEYDERSDLESLNSMFKTENYYQLTNEVPVNRTSIYTPFQWPSN